MSKNGHVTTQDPLIKRRVLLPRGQVEERCCVINHDWLVPVQLLRRLSAVSQENELESEIFPSDESFDSHWQLYLEHQSHPPRIRIGLALLAPRDRCLRADIKLIIMTTHGGQVIKETLFHDHTFFLAKGESISSFINDHISPKIFVDIEGDVYQNVVINNRQTGSFNANDCTIIAYVRFANELEIQPKTKAYDFSRRFTVDWKLTKLRQIIEQINQSRPPIGNDRRLVSDRFQFTHVKLIEGVKSKKWRLLIKCPGNLLNNKQISLETTLKCSDVIHSNYGKVEISCKNEQHILRRYTQSFEDLTDNYTMEFFSFDELTPNFYQYRYEFNENRGRFLTVDYLLLCVQIVQRLNRHDVPKSIKRIVEPTIISLSSTGNVQTKGAADVLKSAKLPRTASVLKGNENAKSPEQRGHSRENLSTANAEPPMPTSWDPFSDDGRPANHVLPPIISRNHQNGTSPDQTNHQSRLQSSTEMRNLPNIQENLRTRSPRSVVNKQIRFASQSRLRSTDRFNQNSSLPSGLASAGSSTMANVWDLPDNFTFLSNLFRSGLHSDVLIRHRDREWRLHKSILSARSIYFNQRFATSNETEVDLYENDEETSTDILDKLFLFLYTNQYKSNGTSPIETPSPATTATQRRRRRSSVGTITSGTTRQLFDATIKYGIDVLTLLCLQDLCNQHNLTIQTAASLLVAIHRATTGMNEKYHSTDYLAQVKLFKQIVLRFIQLHSRDVLLSPQWKMLERQHATLVHDVLEFVVFQKIEE